MKASDLSPEQWKRLDAAFAAALTLTPGERTAFVESALEDEPDLQALGLELLRAHARLGGFLETPGTVVTTAEVLELVARHGNEARLAPEDAPPAEPGGGTEPDRETGSS